MEIRAEGKQDQAAIHRLNVAAFPGPEEAELVDRLRRVARPFLSLVALEEDGVVGHILFTPVTLENSDGLTLMGLAPMAVAPERQRQGIGSALVVAGLQRCRELGAGAVVVLGHPDYYPRFGFRPAVEFGLHSEYQVPNEAFMALELEPAYLDGVDGLVRYHEEFAALPE